MVTQALLALTCWLALVNAEAKNSSIVDNKSEESAPRLYTNALPFGVYATGTPYGAYSFHVPTIVSANQQKDSQAYLKSLKDSYGKFVPQAGGYKSAFPQQYVQLQGLPAHLSQPLLSSPVQFKQGSFFLGPQQYRIPSLQKQAAPTPVTRFNLPVYAGNIKSFSNPGIQTVFRYPIQQHGVGSNQQVQSVAINQQKLVPIVADSAPPGGNSPDPKQQASHSDNRQIQAPAQTSVTAIVNGKKTVITLDTQPPLPLIDLSLLEPLTFDNPLVPQIQHFLPKVASATYHKLPQFNGVPKQRKEVKKPLPQNKSQPRPQNAPAKPTVTLNDSPEVTYEINGPGFKEVYNEQVLSYKKEANSKPVTYSYDEKTNKEPVTYSFAHQSKEPLQVKHVEYESDPQNPKQLIYKFSTGQKGNDDDKQSSPAPRPAEYEESGERSAESGEEESSQEDAPRESEQENDYSKDDRPASYQESSHQPPPTQSSDRDHHNNHYHGEPTYSPQPSGYHREHSHSEEPPQPYQHKYVRVHQEAPRHYHSEHPTHSKGQIHHNDQHRSPKHYNNEYYSHHESPRQSQHLRPEHRTQEYQIVPKTTPVTVTVHNGEFKPITPHYNEDIRVLPTHKPNGAIKVNPSQHLSHSPRKQIQEQYSPSRPQSSPAPHVLEKSKRIIIKENEETPNEMHQHAEQLLAQMVEQEENNEEDFEKAYKESAFGFPAYEQKDDDEKDIYNPEAYGVPRYHNEYKIDHRPYAQYQKEGDDFPKRTRSSYQDARDKMKEDYFLDFSVTKPESYSDHYNKKVDYYKMYKKNRPEEIFSFVDGKKKEKQKESYLVEPLYSFLPSDKKKQKNYSQYKIAPKVEYDYSKEGIHDSSAFSSRAFPSRGHRTHFVEPQFQYGFEPMSAPLVLDSELAAMASNYSPESDPGQRKKLYKENWYIKKTSTTAGKAS